MLVFTVAALGIVKGKERARSDVPGLAELVTALLDILPVRGAKALHDEIKVLLQVSAHREHKFRAHCHAGLCWYD